MEFRKIFDTIPEQFDRYRSRYCDELFADLLSVAEIGPEKTVLELGPGTGQATEPVLRTGCSYSGIELGEHLAQKLREKYGAFPRFHLICDDFITHDFGAQQFDLLYSAATIQWIPEEIAFSKSFSLLKPGGVLAMMMTHSDYKTRISARRWSTRTGALRMTMPCSTALPTSKRERIPAGASSRRRNMRATAEHTAIIL